MSPLSPLLKLAVTALLTLSIIGGLYYWGYSSEKAKWDLEKEKMKQEITLLQSKQAEVTTQVVTQYVDRVKTVQLKGETIVQYVDKYITPAENAACTIPNNFVSLHNAAVKNDIPDPTSATDATPSGVSLAEVEHTVATNYSTCNQLREQVKGLQEWISKQGKLN
jgi:septation ring formation regulator EzrA